VVGKRMPWGEALRLTRILAGDPSSQIAASVAEWEHPISREDMTLRDIFDLQHKAAGAKRPKPYPRPWPDKTKRTFGGGTRMTVAELRAILDEHREGV
jgi:hypothetical protein